jgi:hypothetical protein
LSANDTSFILSILTPLGISAAVGALASAVINNFMTQKEFKRKGQASFIEQRLDMYSHFIYHLDKMRYTYDALSFKSANIRKEEGYAFTDEQWNETVNAIDEKIKDGYYLLTHDILELWVWVKTLRHDPASKDLIRDLRRRLRKDYNSIVKEHQKVLGVGVTSISDDKLVVSLEGTTSSILAGEQGTIMVKVKDSKVDKGIAGAAIGIKIIHTQSGKTLQVQKETDSKGELSYSWKTDTNMVGTYSVLLRVSSNDYDSKLVLETVEVKSNPEPESK